MTVDEHIKGLQQRFGFSDEVLSQYQFDQASQRGIYLSNKDHVLPEGLKKDVTGMLCIKTKTNFPKLATGAAMIVGRYATKNVVTIDVQQLEVYLAQQEFILSEQQIQDCTDTGFVIVYFGGNVIGLGLYLSDQDNQGHRLRSLFPKSI